MRFSLPRTVAGIVIVPWDPGMKAPLAVRTTQSKGVSCLAAAKIRVPGGCKSSLWKTLAVWSVTEREREMAPAGSSEAERVHQDGTCRKKKARQRRQRESVKKASIHLHPRRGLQQAPRHVCQIKSLPPQAEALL